MGLGSFLSSCFSAACSAVGGLCSAIGGALSSACSMIGSMGAAIGSFVAGISASLASCLGPVLALAASINPVTLICAVIIVGFLAKNMGVSDTSPEELGEIALNHPEIKPENFKSYSAYIDELKKHKDEFKREDFEKKPPMEQAAALAVGTGILVKGIEDKLQMEVPLDFITTMIKGGVTPQMTENLLASMSEKGIKSAGVFTDYINGNKLSEAKTLKMDTVMAEFAANGGTTVNEMLGNIDSGRGEQIYEAALKERNENS